jgi:CHASE3 domain sensor protein
MGNQTMKKKIIGIFVCMLMVLTSLGVASALSTTENTHQLIRC